MQARGDYIAGAFHPPTGETFTSRDPARGTVVLETAGDPGRVGMAAKAATEAARAWSGMPFEARLEVIHRFRDVLGEHEGELAEAIRMEMGKIQSEARIEARSLVSRFALVEKQVRAELTDRTVAPGERLVYRPHGVVGVIGPFNFPLHLCHAHVVPALMLGNAVVIKPSETTPLAGERYAAAAAAAGLPPGLLNVVQGGGAVGAALVAEPEIRALAFTGSYAVGRRITKAALDRPELLLALEMGGKNACIVRHDADLRQAIHEIAVSGYLTTGQRCTCADRILVHRSVADALTEGLARVARGLTFGDPTDPNSFGGPLATEASRRRFLAALEQARGHDVLEVVVEGGGRPEGPYVDASLHRLADGVHELPGYLDHELFGPDLVIETFDDDGEAIAALNAAPFGFANSLFTADRGAYERYHLELETGILNLGRSTNQASPRLPFGGLKRSGNFRPAGAWAGRNLVRPVAEIEVPDGVFAPRAAIACSLPSPDLDRLEARHAAEESAEAQRNLFDHPRPESVVLPEGGVLPTSERLLARYHAGGRQVAGEKKPLIVDHLRSRGPFMVSVDEPPLSVLDGMSQTATLPSGFAPDDVVKAYCEGDFGDAVLRSADTTLGEDPRVEAFAETLRSLAPGYPTVSFVNSGAEANEKAYALCRANASEGATRLLAFEGAFHGRTLLALYASHNPAKRVPFQIEGYEVEFAKTPTFCGDPGAEPEGWREVWGAGDVDAARERFGGDPQIEAEVEALADVASKLEGCFAVVVEPMQSEGGDRYLTARFHRALRLLTRARGVSLVMDEVQCGFGLGGSFLWHQSFGYVDRDGGPDLPDCVCFAKRAQSGVCLSVFEDHEPTHAYPASLVRGRLHALSIGDGAAAARVEGWVAARLETFAQRWDHLIENPRSRGYALAFDLPSPAHLGRYLGQRFWRGVVVFGAGTRTVRYRLSSSWSERDVDTLFDSMQRSLSWLEAHPGKSPPSWEDLDGARTPSGTDADVVIRVASPEEADTLLPEILALEAKTYEPARRDTKAWLGKAFSPDGVAIVAERDGQLVGSALGAPLESVRETEGPDRDPMLDRANTLYSLAITVDPAERGKGIGLGLKRAQLERAAQMRTPEGARRYLHGSGRNRVPDASSMARLNNRFGAYTVAMLDGQYEGGGTARYYRQPLGRFDGPPVELDDAAVDLASGLARPLATPPESLSKLYRAGALYGPTVSKLTVLNYLTPAAVRAVEYVAALRPDLPHHFLCSSRDETVDKSVRLLRWHRTSADTVVAFEGAYVGHTTAGARSISDPSTHRQGPAYFDWPRVRHPADGVDASIDALDALIASRGADRIFGIYISPVQERTGRVVPDEFWPRLAALREKTGVPVVLVETPTAFYRSGHGAFASSGLAFTPDVAIWWAGGQLGFMHVSDAYHLSKPFTLVSTWDGDELSLIQAHHQLRSARQVDVAVAIEAWDAALDGHPASGLGLYRVLELGDEAQSVHAALRQRGIRTRVYPGGYLALVPALDRAAQDAPALGEALRAVRA